jgi:dolichol-phosphate mannosyltransferase
MDIENKDAFSIIIPTYQEAKNLPGLAERIANVNFGNRDFEVILADDNSEDGTPQIVEKLSKKHPWLKLLTRHNKKRDLSESILDGFKAARYPILITMDADLSHPPEKIPEMLTILEDPKVDAVIGSRYIKGGSTDPTWPITRVLTSRFAALIARVLLFTRARDPLSGFLAIRQKTIQAGAPLKPIGWKVGLEIIIKCHCKNIREIPIHFSQRLHGSSKLNLRISADYLHHVARLMWHKIS